MLIPFPWSLRTLMVHQLHDSWIWASFIDGPEQAQLEPQGLGTGVPWTSYCIGPVCLPASCLCVETLACLPLCTRGSPSQDNSVTEPVSPLFLIQAPHSMQCMLSLILIPTTLDVGVPAFLTLFIGVHTFPSLPGTWKMRTLRLRWL